MPKIKNLRKKTTLNSSINLDIVSSYSDYLVEWIKSKVEAAKCKGVILGLSGGIDSSLLAALAKKAFPENHLCLVLPINSMERDLDDLNKLIQSQQINVKTIDLKQTYNSIIEANKDLTNQLVLNNIKPRLRMTTLYAQAQERNYLVLGTSNLDEYHIGYFTKYGDGGSDLLPLSFLLKDDIRILAKYLKIPESIINKQPSAGLWASQTDEGELGFTYNDLDNYLLGNLNEVDSKISNKIKKLNETTFHKREAIPRPLSIKDFIKEQNKSKKKEK